LPASLPDCLLLASSELGRELVAKMFRLETRSVHVFLLVLAAALDTSAAADTSSANIAAVAAEARNTGSDDFGWNYIIAAVMLAAAAVMAKEALDGRCFRRRDAGQEQANTEELLLLETGVATGAPQAAGAAVAPLPSLLVNSARANDKFQASKNAASMFVTDPALTATGMNGSEDV